MKHLIILTILGLSSVVYCQAQKPKPSCDFSPNKPLVISHALLKAAIKKVQPQYPPSGTWAKANGTVSVKILVDRKGNVVQSCALSGHPLLRESAEKAALGWKFKENFGLSKKSKLVKRHKYIESEIDFIFNLLSHLRT